MLWLFGGATLALFLVLGAIDQRMWDEGGPGIVGFELAGSEEASRDMLAEWGDEGRDAARLSLWLDFPFLIFYGAFFTLAVAAVRDAARRLGWRRLSMSGVVLLPGLAALFDALENIGLLLALGEHGGAVAPVAATVCAAVKFLLLFVVDVYLVVGLVRLAHRRFRRPTRIALAALALLVVALLAVNTWAVERETEDAEADIGRIVELPQGDIHVREDGDPRKPPMLLIHGYAVSMHWWDRVVPQLAREHRVIRLDLLGHGGSEKPRNGYSMEEQADVVATVLEELGVRRTAVVGHSMGGIVATAVVERHPGIVSRLMTIGTPPDEPEPGPRVTDRLAYVPVIGHAAWSLINEDYVRSQVETTSPPEIDLPREITDDPSEVTYRVFRESSEGIADYWDEAPLDERLADEGVPLTVVVGEEDEPEEAEDFRRVPGARISVLEGLGHSPHVERPGRTAELILDFARSPSAARRER
jgi:pimeloyl-ACP methyl ester carboxylesterase